MQLLSAAPSRATGRASIPMTGNGPAAVRPILELSGVTVRYGQGERATLAVSGFNLALEEKSFVSLIGPSGCGKSSVLNLMAGYLSPTEGQVLMEGRPVLGPGPDRMVVHQQTTALLPWLSVEDNVALGLRARGMSKAVSRAAAQQYLEMVRLAGFGKHPIYQLSGGMRQRVALARALATEAKVVLLDEPLGAIDALQRGIMQDLLLRLWAESGRTFFLITHSVEEALYLGTTVLAMSSRPGRIVAQRAASFGRAALQGDGTRVRTAPEFSSTEADLLEILTAAGEGTLR